MLRTALTLLIAAVAALGESTSAAQDTLPWVADAAEQQAAYAAPVRKTVVQLQPFRRSQTLPIPDGAGGQGSITLIDLNPQVGQWYLLVREGADGATRELHLENAIRGQVVALDPDDPGSLALHGESGEYRCDVWSGTTLADAAAQATAYASLCEGRLFLHNAVRGHSSRLEAVVEFLRRHVPAGESLISATKQTVLNDAAREPAELNGRVGVDAGASPMPTAARLAPGYAGREIGRASLGIRAAGAGQQALVVGEWTPVAGVPGTFLSLMTPSAIAPEILQGARDRANALDARESAALVYAVAFDLAQLELGFGLGTDHPGVGWSPRPPASVRPAGMPGPDGIDTVRPLVMSGMIPPVERPRTVAAFVGGFKRYHGAFKFGAMAARNQGSHYGFVQEGVVLSRLQPGLSTLYVLNDGSVHMDLWTEALDERLPEVRYARQNGVPLVQWDAATDAPVPGTLVNQWGPGNWSGSAEGALRTVRGGACLQQAGNARYLIYAYFSSATPSAMARVFQAYGCRHAMQLDINAPILTYLALYRGHGPDLDVQYLVQSMVEAEQKVEGQPVPRFLVMPDNRDFFYLMRRGGEQR